MVNEFPIIELRRRFASAFPPKPLIYWSDLFVSAGIGWGAFLVAGRISVRSPLFFVAATISVFALLRATIFIHEIAHLKERTLVGFVFAWHLVIGLPLLLPSLMYVGSHNDHHRQPTFGTIHDPEYIPLAHWSRFRTLSSFMALAFVPFLLLLRWGVLGPLSFVVPSLRQWLIECASTLVINPDYRRPRPQGKRARQWVVQEGAVSLTAWSILSGAYWGWFAFHWIVQWYVVAIIMLMVNQLRTLAAHRYDNTGAPLDATAQLLDSVTLSGRLLPTVLAAPVGLRFHALHHLLPTVPYHSLGTLHRRLLAEFPANSSYARTQESSITSAVRKLLWLPARADAKLPLPNAAVRAPGKTSTLPQ